MAFFEAPEPAFEAPDPGRLEPVEEPEPKPWWGPPERTLPGRLVDTLILAHTARVAVVVADLAAYPTGFSFALQTIPRRYGPRKWAELDHFGWGHGVQPDGTLPEALLRFGIEFADGGRATSLDILARRDRDPDEPPDPPVLWQRGGRGGGGRSSHDAWVWPLPPPGPLTFACEWPALGIPLIRRDIDAALSLDAAKKAEVLWPDSGG